MLERVMEPVHYLGCIAWLGMRDSASLGYASSLLRSLRSHTPNLVL
jgi:hypothetical protein